MMPLQLPTVFMKPGCLNMPHRILTLLDGFLSDPNDPLYSYQWEHKNTGSPVQYNGTPGGDMAVQQAWGISTGTGIKVAVTGRRR